MSSPPEDNAVLTPYGVLSSDSDVDEGSFYLRSQGAHDPPRVLGQPDSLPVGAIGWTQDSISRVVYNVTAHRHTDIQNVVNASFSAPEGPVAYLQTFFPQRIRIYWHTQFGYLSIDNRRLAIYRMVLPTSQSMPVQILTWEEAARELSRNPDPDRQSMENTMRARHTTRDGGYSIVIRNNTRTVISEVSPSPSSPWFNAPTFYHDEL